LNLDWAAAARMSSKDDVAVGLVLAMALIPAPGSRLLLLRSRLTQLVTPTGSDEGTTNMGPQIGMLRTEDCERKAASLAVEGKRAPARRRQNREPKTNIASRRQKQTWQAAAGTACAQEGTPQGLLAGHLLTSSVCCEGSFFVAWMNASEPVDTSQGEVPSMFISPAGGMVRSCGDVWGQ
jgi:hypothetical protein